LQETVSVGPPSSGSRQIAQVDTGLAIIDDGQRQRQLRRGGRGAIMSDAGQLFEQFKRIEKVTKAAGVPEFDRGAEKLLNMAVVVKIHTTLKETGTDLSDSAIMDAAVQINLAVLRSELESAYAENRASATGAASD
jgi:hypothetical protein